MISTIWHCSDPEKVCGFDFLRPSADLANAPRNLIFSSVSARSVWRWNIGNEVCSFFFSIARMLTSNCDTDPVSNRFSFFLSLMVRALDGREVKEISIAIILWKALMRSKSTRNLCWSIRLGYFLGTNYIARIYGLLKLSTREENLRSSRQMRSTRLLA